MSFGPIELVVIKFPGNQFKGEVAPELEKLVKAGVVRVIDVLFVRKDKDGDITVVEINEVDDETSEAFGPLVTALAGLLTPDDAKAFAAAMEPQSSMALMLFENTWAGPFVEAVRNANGKIVMNERIPRAIVEKLVAESAA